MNVDLTELRYFYFVATTHSFAEGARRAHVSPPAISKGIKKLETQLGTELLHRTTRKVVMTEAGEIVLEHAKRLLATMDDLGRALDDDAGILRGEIRIGTMEAFSTFALPRAISRMVDAHPELVPKTYMMSPEQMEQRLLEGRLDIGLSIGTEGTKHVDHTLLIESPTSLVCGPDHPLAGRETIGPQDVAEHPFVVPQFHDREFLPALDQFPERDYQRRIGATVELMQMAVQLVMDGHFLGYFPNVAIRCQLNHRELIALRGLEPGPSLQLVALTRPGAPAKPAVPALVEALKVSLREALQIECAP